MGFNDAYGSFLKEYPDILIVEEVSKTLGISTKIAYRIPKVRLLSYMKVSSPSSANV